MDMYVEEGVPCPHFVLAILQGTVTCLDRTKNLYTTKTFNEGMPMIIRNEP